MYDFIKSPTGRIALHILAYGLAAFAVAVVGQLQLIDFGEYQPVASVVLGAAMDALRKYKLDL